MQLILSMSDVKTALKQHFNLNDNDTIVIREDSDSDYEFISVPNTWIRFSAPPGFPKSGSVEIVTRGGYRFVTKNLSKWEWTSFWVQDECDGDFVKFRKVKELSW